MSLYEIAVTGQARIAFNDLSSGAVLEISRGEARRLFANLNLKMDLGDDPHVAFTTTRGVEAWLRCSREEAAPLAARIDRLLHIADALLLNGGRA